MNIIDESKLNYALDFVLKRIDDNLEAFTDFFPSQQSENYIYQKSSNFEWTPGFWTAMIWLAYEFTGNKKYFDAATRQLKSYRERFDNKITIDCHDLGLVYLLSCGAAYKINKNEFALETAVLAADHLVERFNPNGKYIQAWGKMNSEGNCRLIADSMLIIPFLFWASEATGDLKYRNVAEAHLNTLLGVIMRPDNTTHHTYFFDPESGMPLYGKTEQGYSDDSCWARGQSWIIAGTAINYKYVKNTKLLDIHKKVTDKYIELLPEDSVPYWDMIFTDKDNEPRDTSAAAIAVCGILEMCRYNPDEKHVKCASDMINALIDNYLTINIQGSNGILSDGMYNRNAGHKPESNLWGDYFFFEALIRIKRPDIKLYW